jgi:hypothetical protein
MITILFYLIVAFTKWDIFWILSVGQYVPMVRFIVAVFLVIVVLWDFVITTEFIESFKK